MLLDNYVLHSGGADGADTEWDIQGEPFGVTARHYYAAGQRTPRGNTPLNKAQLSLADPWLHRVNTEVLHRTFPASSEWVNNLLRRNYYQVINANAIYAVGRFMDGLVAGGTAWAVYMGVLMGKRVYFFDQKEEQWFKFDFNGAKFDAWLHIDTPSLRPHFAGIGTRKLNDAGRQAIADAYKQTLSK